MDPEQNNKEDRIQHAITKLIGSPLEPGTLLKAEIFEELLGISRYSTAFSFLISDIRRALYNHGIYLSGEGFKETGAYEIWAGRDNYWIARLALERAERDLEGKLVLLINTAKEGFSDLEKRRHENMTRELSMKLNAIQHARELEKMFKKGKKFKQDLIEESSSAQSSSA